MYSYQFLLLLLPIKLFALKLTRIFDFLAFFLESLVGHVVNFLDIMDILFSFMLRMIINLKWPLWSHKIWIGLRVIICGNLFPVEGKTYYSPYIIRSIMHRTFCHKFVETFILTIEIISSLIESVHVFLAFWDVGWWLIVGWLGLGSWFADSLAGLSIASHGVVVGEVVTGLGLLRAHDFVSLASLRVELPVARSNAREGHSVGLRGVHRRVQLASAAATLAREPVREVRLGRARLRNWTFLFRELGWVQFPLVRFDIVGGLIATSSVASEQKRWLQLLKISLWIGKTTTSMRLGSFASTFPESPLANLERRLFDKLVVVFVLLWNLWERVIVVQWFHLLMHHLVFRPIDMTLQEIAKVRVVVRLAVVSAEKTGDLIFLWMLGVENWVVAGAADSGLVVEVLGANIPNRTRKRRGHLGGWVKITDTLEFNGLRRLDPQLSNREIQSNRLLLGEGSVKCKLTQPW